MFLRKRTRWSKIVFGNFHCTEVLPHQCKAETIIRGTWTYFHVCNIHFGVYKNARRELEWQTCCEDWAAPALKSGEHTDAVKHLCPHLHVAPNCWGCVSCKGYCTITFPLKHGKKIKFLKHYKAAGWGPCRHSPLCGVKWIKWSIVTPSW